MKTIDPNQLSVGEFHSYILGSVAPRPIAFASSIDKDGKVNLSPFSFFNAFSANPPILVFSPARRVRNNTTKHTLDNVIAHPEVVINIVNYNIAEQMSFTSSDFEKGVNEFEKAGLTQVSSEVVKPPRVGESPAAFECKVNQVIPLGQDGGAGNLVICEILLAHFNEEILDENGKIDPLKYDVIGRMGGNWYTRAVTESLFQIAKPVGQPGIGLDEFDESIVNSKILTGNDLGRLANTKQIPSKEEVMEVKSHPQVVELLNSYQKESEEYLVESHKLAKIFIDLGEINNAWKILLM